MKIYTIHVNNKIEDEIERVKAVEESFSFKFLIFSFIYALFHKMWFTSAITFGFYLVFITALQSGLNHFFVFAVYFLVLITMAFKFFDIKRYGLEMQDYRIKDIILANSEQEAILRYLK